MELIAHRGNLDGPKPSQENQVEYILSAIEAGFSVEIDLWLTRAGWFLGHDDPQYEVRLDVLRQVAGKLYVHVKSEWQPELPDLLADFEFFFHDDEPYVLTSRNKKWYLPNHKVHMDGINLMPEHNWELDNFKQKAHGCVGVCSDWVAQLK